MRCVQCNCDLSKDSVLLTFDSGRSWVVAERALHYYACHRWSPPADLLEDVMTHRMIPYNPCIHTEPAVPIGFINENDMFFQSSEEPGFFTKFWALMWFAAKINQRMAVDKYQSRKARFVRACRTLKNQLAASFAKAGTVVTLGALFPRS